jgi:hypothetical protein
MFYVTVGTANSTDTRIYCEDQQRNRWPHTHRAGFRALLRTEKDLARG